MTLEEILKFNIIETGKYTLSVYNIFIAVIIILITNIILILFKRILNRLADQKRIDKGTSMSFFQIVRYLIWIISILLVLDSLNIKITILLASSAALMVGLGLGLQKIFQDFVSGFTLLVEGSLKTGDVIQTHNGEVGKVLHVGIRTSKIETRDNIIIIVPNSNLINESLINWSHIAKNTRFEVRVGIAYGSDVSLVKKLLLICAQEHPNIEKHPTPIVLFDDFGDSSLNFRLLFHTKNTFRVESIKSDLRFKIDAIFRENSITIPFPQRDIHIINK